MAKGFDEIAAEIIAAACQGGLLKEPDQVVEQKFAIIIETYKKMAAAVVKSQME